VGIVVDRVVARVRQITGRDYRWIEWDECCADLGLVWVEVPELRKPAYLVGKLIVLRAGMRPMIRAFHAWEEIGHHLTVAGNREHWRTRLPGLQGELNVARFERRARDLRASLPADTTFAASFLPIDLPTPNVTGFTKDERQ
jgi:hypothetical protein